MESPVCSDSESIGSESPELTRVNVDLSIDADGSIKIEIPNFIPPQELLIPSAPPLEIEENISSISLSSSDPISLFNTPLPKLNIVIMIVGSRGDVQPFIALSLSLMKLGHRVRLATHETFRSFIRNESIEFFPLAGDPHELMAYMVKNPGLIPGLSSVLAGDIGKKTKMMKEILHSCWASCTEPDKETDSPFLANVIISNPTTFAHIHCAEKLSIPLHIFFTMPWSPTKAFSHPLTRITQNDFTKGAVNYLSYSIAENLTWTGLGPVVNKFRETLFMKKLPAAIGTNVLHDLCIPHTYCWSPSLIPKPDDWGPHIDVVGFFFVSQLSQNYTPPSDLDKFLQSGPPPIYIGFGSIVVEDPDGFTKLIIDAIKTISKKFPNLRFLLSKGWGGIGGDNVPDNVFLLGNVPHDWLFERCSAVVHHGGAGTTAAGLRAGLPTIIVPFFGDQGFWGTMVHSMGVGPNPIPFKNLSVSNLSSAIEFSLKPPVILAAKELGVKMKKENGVELGTHSILRHLSPSLFCCDLEPSRIAVAKHREYKKIKLSSFIVNVLILEQVIKPSDVKELKVHKLDTEYDTRGAISYLTTSPANFTKDYIKGAASIFTQTHSAYKDVKQKNTNSPVLHMTQNFAKGVGLTLYIPFVRGNAKFIGGIANAFRAAAHTVDPTYNRMPKVDGAYSGAVEAVKSFGNGLKGVTDIITKPIEGAQKEGVKGCAKGIALGFAGSVLKPVSGTLDLLALSGKGLYLSAKAVLNKDVVAIALWERKMKEGEEEAKAVEEQQRKEIVKRFLALKSEQEIVQKRKSK